MKRTLAQFGWPLGVFAAVIVLWHLSTRSFGIPAYILPDPLRVLSAGWERRQSLLLAVKTSAVEAGGGFLLSGIAGVLIAFVLAQSAVIRRCMFPYTILLQTVPIVAIAPLILMWFGSGLGSVVLIVFIICLFPIVANTTQGLISVDPNLLNLFRMSNASRREVLFKLRLPHAMPGFFVGLRISAGLSVVGAFTGEWFASSNTVGEGGARVFHHLRQQSAANRLPFRPRDRVRRVGFLLFLQRHFLRMAAAAQLARFRDETRRRIARHAPPTFQRRLVFDTASRPCPTGRGLRGPLGQRALSPARPPRRRARRHRES